jgi:hypothetical protein
MTAIVPITHDEERLARQAGNHLCRAGQFLLQKGTAPALAEVLVLAALADRDRPSLGPDQRAEVESLRPSLIGPRPLRTAWPWPISWPNSAPLQGSRLGMLRLPSELVGLMDALAAGTGGVGPIVPFLLPWQSAVLGTRRYESVVFQDASPPDPLMEALLALFPAVQCLGRGPFGSENAPAPARPWTASISAGTLAKRITRPAVCAHLPADKRLTSNGELLRLDSAHGQKVSPARVPGQWGFWRGQGGWNAYQGVPSGRRCVLDAVVQLPGNLVSGTRWNAALLVVDAGRDKAAPVRLVDASDGHSRSAQRAFYPGEAQKGWREVADCLEEDRLGRVRLSGWSGIGQATATSPRDGMFRRRQTVPRGNRIPGPSASSVSTVRGKCMARSPEAWTRGDGSAEHLFLRPPSKTRGRRYAPAA